MYGLNTETIVVAIEYSPELSKLGLTWHFWINEVHHKQRRFGNTKCLQSTEKYLQIISNNVPLASVIDCLKTENLDYLPHKKQHSVLRDTFINSSPERKEELKTLRKRENLKAKWKKHRLAFSKSKMNSISEIEWEKDGLSIIKSNKFET